MFKIIKNNISLILLLAVSFFLAFANYTLGTFLSGWDTLHPEFNFGLAFQREINGVFRIEQGLGAVAAHSHMADLPHLAILYLSHFFLPLSFLRYFYIFITLIAGPIGMYFFLNKYIVKNKIASFLGSVFYLLNLGTMQIFIVPFEMFTTQYALLPWLFLFATEYIYSDKKSINKLLFFSLTTLLATPMAYAATLWYVYFFIFISYVLSLNLFDHSINIFKKSAILILVTLAVNSFWILPNFYFVLNHGKTVSEALINQLFSPQAFLYNKEFGNIKDIALMKNFLFDWSVYGGKDGFIPLLSPWINHLKQNCVQLIGFLFAIFAFAGITSVALKKNRILISLLLPLLFCLFFLINDNPPTSFLYNFLQNKVPLFKEAFRFPDDKVLGIFTFVFTIYFAQGQKMILKFIRKFKIVYLIVILSLITYYSLPAFKGNLISPFMRVSIPKDYFKMFDWFRKQDKTARIANLPIHSAYGWEYYSWNNGNPSFQGADFLQFGIPQPLLSRDFDRWNPNNEQYYREMSQAIYSQNQAKLDNVLQKYDISYILWDRSIIAPEQGKDNKVLFLPEIENLLDSDSNLVRIAHFGDLLVYETEFKNPQIRLIRNPVSMGPSAVFYDDFAYAKYHDYITYSNPEKNTVLYPFRNIIDNQNRIISKDVPTSFSNSVTLDPKLTVNTGNDCSPINSLEKTNFQKTITAEKENNFIEYSSLGGSFCEHFSYPILPRNQGYLISIDSRNVQGLPLRICVRNYISNRCDLFTHLLSSKEFTQNVFLIPPTDQSIGFDINIDNFSVKNNPSINDLQSIEVSLFDYIKLSQIETYPTAAAQTEEKNVLVYSQSFDSGWKAYKIEKGEMKNEKYLSSFTSQLSSFFPFLFGKEIKEHVLVNNWANGWVLNSQLSTLNSQLVIIFWPQYLEYLGFGILIGTFAWLFWSSVKSNRD